MKSYEVDLWGCEGAACNSEEPRPSPHGSVSQQIPSQAARAAVIRVCEREKTTFVAHTVKSFSTFFKLFPTTLSLAQKMFLPLSLVKFVIYAHIYLFGGGVITFGVQKTTEEEEAAGGKQRASGCSVFLMRQHGSSHASGELCNITRPTRCSNPSKSNSW